MAIQKLYQRSDKKVTKRSQKGHGCWEPSLIIEAAENTLAAFQGHRGQYCPPLLSCLSVRVENKTANGPAGLECRALRAQGLVTSDIAYNYL